MYALSIRLTNTRPISFDVLRDQRILVVGGSGRVGGSVVTQLVQHGANVTVGGTRRTNFEISQQRWMRLFPDIDGIKALGKVNFVELNREQSLTIPLLQKQENNRDEPIKLYDLVVHTAGPFQGKVTTPNGVLLASVEASIPYIDVCDDYCTASAAKTEYCSMAQENNVPCIVSTGCWPGVSSLMAKQLVALAIEAFPEVTPSDLSIRFAFFTAGSGGAGVTLLVATFLILAEKALTIVRGRRRLVNAMETYSTVNFGRIVGSRDVAPLNLLETASIHDTLGVGSTQSLFGTAPNFWNALLGFMAKLPADLLANEDIMRKLSVFSLPVVRVVDYFAGATNAMRCDVTYCSQSENQINERGDSQPSFASSWQATAIYAHDNLEPCVGECVAAFCCAILSGRVPAGVWFPEEAIVTAADAGAVLNLASVGAHTTTVETQGIPMSQREESKSFQSEYFWGKAD